MFQKKYVIGKEKKTYADSSAHCESQGGTLALPESAEDNEQILHQLSKHSKLLFHFRHVFSAESRDTILAFSIRGGHAYEIIHLYTGRVLTVTW